MWGLESTEEQMHNEAVMLKMGFSFKKTGREEKELLVDKTRGRNISENFLKKISWGDLRRCMYWEISQKKEKLRR